MQQKSVNFGPKCSPAIQKVPQAPLAVLAGFFNSEKTDKSTGEHFNRPGHSLSNMTVTILEKIYSNDIFYRKERETYHIRKFNTFDRGLNLRH